MSEDDALIVAILILSAIMAGIPIASCYISQPQTTSIESASLSGQTEGSFGIFGGTVNEEQHYFFYKEKNGGHILDKVRADNTVIVETDKKEPHVVERSCGNENTLYVPEGTVVMDYSVAQPGVKK